MVRLHFVTIGLSEKDSVVEYAIDFHAHGQLAIELASICNNYNISCA